MRAIRAATGAVIAGARASVDAIQAALPRRPVPPRRPGLPGHSSGIDDATIEAALGALSDVRAEVVRRAVTIKRVPDDLCPDGEVTRQAV